MTAILRPKFSEGQILGAEDLDGLVTYDRRAMVLHERTEHLWGVAQGMRLHTGDPQTAAKYVDVTLQPGRAVDRLGRSIVVSQDIPLDPQDLAPLISGTPKGTELYPVYVQALDIQRIGQTQPGKCAVNQVKQIEEGVQISFGLPGSEISILDQVAATVDQELDAASLSDKVLVGWVTWNANATNFAGVATSASGRGIRYVGVVASEVVAGGGTLGLRTRPGGPRYAITLTENTTGGCELRFGKQDGDGPVAKTFSVDEQGNVYHAGSLTPTPVARTRAESGVVSDGVCLPLPKGVTEDQLGTTTRLHAIVTPVPLPPDVKSVGNPPAAKTVVPLVIECGVDLGTRRVTCKVRWYDPTKPDDFIDQPGSCNYLLVASGGEGP